MGSQGVSHHILGGDVLANGRTASEEGPSRVGTSRARMGTPYLTNMREMLNEGTATYL